MFMNIGMGFASDNPEKDQERLSSSGSKIGMASSPMDIDEGKQKPNGG
jgi:hypothetical protein